MSQSTQLHRSLVQLALLHEDSVVPSNLPRGLTAASDSTWSRVLDDLLNHRTAPLISYSIRRLGLESQVPPVVIDRLAESYQGTLLANTMQARLLSGLLETFSEHGIEPIVMKGLVLADRYYPDLGTRPMVDIDLLVDETDAAGTEAVLRDLGYERGAPWSSYVQEGTGYAVDLHTEFALFDPELRTEITEYWSAPALGLDRVKTWEPNAMLMHLVQHFDKHTHGIGASLLWVLDIVLLVRASSDRLSLPRLRNLAGAEHHLPLLWQILRLADREFGAAAPEAFQAEVASSKALSLPWILRQRRLQRWGFPHRHFYTRVGARILRLRPLGYRQWIRWSDIPNGWIDCLIDRRTTR